MDFDERVWYQQFKCPLCGYKTNVTNVCRQCVETPADWVATRPVFCYTHKTFHQNKKKEWTMHRAVNMVKTEWAERFNPNLRKTQRKKVKNLPKDAILK